MVSELLESVLEDLRKLPHETEWVEFKEAKQGYDFGKLGEYVSALANEANLKNRSCAWLVFGVRDNDRAIVGSCFRQNVADLDHLKQEVAARMNGGFTFLDIHPLEHADGRVVMFQIPPAPRGVPIAWQGHWYGRNGASIGPLALHELEAIRAQRQAADWSAAICADAKLDDLDPNAVAVARANFRTKHKDKEFARNIDNWSTETFLDRARLTSEGRITRTSLLLLGRPHAAHFLQPAVAQITWRLEGEERAYEHFGPPFLLTVNELYARIRNIAQKIDVPRQLVPLELPKYEKWVVLEALHNAIAHQDYDRQARIVVTEMLDRLTFESAGNFFEGKVNDYTLDHCTPQRYRNRFLADAMVNVNMIDTMGYGIQRMFAEQRNRFYPLPDFSFSQPERVVVTIHGRVIDPNYTALLMEQRHLPLRTVILLDRVQKRQPLPKDEIAALRTLGMVEGRFPNVFVAAHVASLAGDRARYIRNRAFDDQHYKQLIVKYLQQYRRAGRREIDTLLLDKLSDVLNERQRRNKVKNLLSALANDGLIRNAGSRRYPQWMMVAEKRVES